jgi:hypothetical protein
MSTVRELHDKAAKLAQLAMIARHEGERERAEDLARQAYEYESQAAELVPDDKSSEPTRSILYLSAASLAYQCREFQTAQRLIAKGLSGYPPPRTEQDLKDLFEQVNFEHHLEVRDVILDDSDLQVSMMGKTVGFGMVLYDEFKKTIEDTVKLIDRTVERKMGRDYRRGAGRPRGIYRPFVPALSIPRAGSFAVTLRLGQEKQMSYFFTTPQVIDEILTGIELINNADEEGLIGLIGDESYRLNFLALTRDMAPDGDKISFVGFTSRNRAVSLTRPRSSIELPEIEPAEGGIERRPIEVEGVLDFAKRRGQDIIELNPEEGRPYRVFVGEGMDDVVRSYFGNWVTVTGVWVRDAEGERIFLRDIRSADIQD